MSNVCFYNSTLADLFLYFFSPLWCLINLLWLWLHRLKQKRTEPHPYAYCPAATSTVFASRGFWNILQTGLFDRVPGPGPLPVVSLNEDVKLHYGPPNEAPWGGDGGRKERRGGGEGGQVPGAPCDGTPHQPRRHGSGGTRGGAVLGEGTRSKQRGGRSFGMNYPPAEPLLWGCWRRGHVSSGPQTHTQALSATTTRLCVRPASHNSYSAFSTNTSTHTHTHEHTLGEDELGRLRWSNRTAPAAAGH